MSTQTAALPDGTKLTKPASGEKVSLSVINTNTDNIANNIIALNGYVNAHWLGNNTLSNTQSALFSFAQSMPDGGSRVIEFGISQATGNFGATNYIGKIERISASRLCVTVMNAMYATNMIIGNYKDGTWNWAEVALVSQINTLSSQIATELASKQYVFSTSSASTLAEQVLAFCENHRGQSNYTASFFMSASNAPSDLPANTNTWKYAFGEARIRISPLSGGIDGVIILYAFSANQMALRYISNSVVSNEWKVFS